MILRCHFVSVPQLAELDVQVAAELDQLLYAWKDTHEDIPPAGGRNPPPMRTGRWCRNAGACPGGLPAFLST